jgi:hypothetical protein
VARSNRRLERPREQVLADLVTLLGRALPQLPDREGVSQRLRAMWDGFSIGIVTGSGAALRAAALEHTAAALRPL